MTTRPARDKSYEQRLEEERLIVAATEHVCELMDDQSINRSELASRINRTKGYVTQLLSGERNLTLRTLAELAFALGSRVSVDLQPLAGRPKRPTVRSVSVDEVKRSAGSQGTYALTPAPYRRSLHRCRAGRSGTYEQIARQRVER